MGIFMILSIALTISAWVVRFECREGDQEKSDHARNFGLNGHTVNGLMFQLLLRFLSLATILYSTSSHVSNPAKEGLETHS